MKLIAALYLLAFVSDPPSDRLKHYPVPDSYIVEPDIIATPIYRGEHTLCELSFERRHYSPAKDSVDMDATMSKQLIVSLFDRLSPLDERGWAGWGKPGEFEYTDIDGSLVTTRIPYQHVWLYMFGKRVPVKGWEQKYVAAIIKWEKPECKTK